MSHVEHTATLETTVAQAWELMRETGTRLLPVVADARCRGVATSELLIDAAAPGVPKDCELPLSEVIDYSPLGVRPDDELQLVLEVIAANDDGVLVVADAGGSLLGVITCLDAVSAAARLLRRRDGVPTATAG